MNKVLFLMQLPPPVHGASMVNQMIFESDFIKANLDCKFVNISPAKEVRDIGRASVFKVLKSIKVLFQCVWAYMKFRPDIVYLTLSPHGIAFWKDSAIAFLIKLIGGKIVFHMHGKGVLEESKRSRFRELYYRQVFKNVQVIHLSELLKYDVQKYVPESSLYIVNNGVRDSLPVGCNELHSDGLVKFVYLSNFIREKGAMDLVEALNYLKDKANEFSVTFVGKFFDSEFEKEFKETLGNIGFENVQLVEGLYGDEKDQLLSNADVFVLPTYYKNECFPLTILEAMSHSLAIIATDEGAIADMVNNHKNGIIINKKSSGDLSRAMRQYIDDRELLSKAKACSREEYLKRFSIEVFEKKLVDVLGKCYKHFYL